MTSSSLSSKWRIVAALSLIPLLSSCASPTKPEPIVVTEYILPPEGLIVPCYKPQVIGTWPQIVTQDIPRLKAALSECAAQADEYLKWRTQKNKPG
ncbi:Rz1-like lysis system protein LysC [Vibrio navarrensis]